MEVKSHLASLFTVPAFYFGFLIQSTNMPQKKCFPFSFLSFKFYLQVLYKTLKFFNFFVQQRFPLSCIIGLVTILCPCCYHTHGMYCVYKDFSCFRHNFWPKGCFTFYFLWDAHLNRYIRNMHTHTHRHTQTQLQMPRSSRSIQLFVHITACLSNLFKHKFSSV